MQPIPNIKQFSSKQLSLTVVSWAIWTSLYAWIVYAAGEDLRQSLTDSFISNFILFLTGALLINLLKHYLPGKESYVNLVAIVSALTVLWFLVSKFIVITVGGRKNISIDFFRLSDAIRLAISFLVLGCVTLIFVLKRTLEEKEVQSQRKADAEKLAKEAELFRLRQQLQPHFLFNSLNSISALVSRDPVQARKMIEQLSDFLRSTVKKENEQMTTLEEEFRDLELYLSIEKLRFGHRLSTTITKDENVSNNKIPALLLQPVLENAIKYGIYDTTDAVNILVSATKKDNMLQVTIQNPYDPDTLNTKSGTGFGLASVQRRLYLLFARTDLLKTEIKNNLFTTTIQIPQYD
jgi:sensor histidine kinase YesM